MTTPFKLYFMLAVTAGLLGLAMVSAQQPTPTPTSVFTAPQADAGRAAYQARCAGCHLPDMSGRNEAAPLAGANFMNAWRGRSTRELYEYISATMPPGGANLGAETYLADNGLHPAVQWRDRRRTAADRDYRRASGCNRNWRARTRCPAAHLPHLAHLTPAPHLSHLAHPPHLSHPLLPVA